MNRKRTRAEFKSPFPFALRENCKGCYGGVKNESIFLRNPKRFDRRRKTGASENVRNRNARRERGLKSPLLFIREKRICFYGKYYDLEVMLMSMSTIVVIVLVVYLIVLIKKNDNILP